MSSNARARQTHGTDSVLGSPIVGRPIHFVGGQFAGRTVRAELQELQKADLGRKYARVDRRPLDPPPVVLLRLFYVYDAGTPNQWEEEVHNYQDVQNLGIMCTVDLFPIPGSITADNALNEGIKRPCPSSAVYHVSTALNLPKPALTYVPSNPDPIADAVARMPPIPPLYIPCQPGPGHPTSSDPPQLESVVLRIGNHLITECSKLTPALVGGTFVEPTLVEYQGKKALVFVFADLAVKREGIFMLRYRTFDIFSFVSGTSKRPIQAELYGGSFKVYSTRDFPGLQASTELTKSLSRFGVRLTVRDTERKSKPKRKQSNTISSYTEDIGNSKPIGG